jgi:hypothetical protein
MHEPIQIDNNDHCLMSVILIFLKKKWNNNKNQENKLLNGQDETNWFAGKFFKEISITYWHHFTGWSLFFNLNSSENMEKYSLNS